MSQDDEQRRSGGTGSDAAGVGDAEDDSAVVASEFDEAPDGEGKQKDKVYEAGGIIICDDKIALRFTDGGNWIFPKGKLKKHESPEDAAIREAVEETGLKVEVVGDAGGFRLNQHGKPRRFHFYLMRAVGTTWDWPHHEGRDTFVMDADRVGALLRKGYRALWECCEPQVRALIASDVGTAGVASRPEDPSPYPLPDSGRG
jgi:8-oxo-dGTP pyrophosphatase MutT (NUDIX family)